jgi:UDP-GlcNAc:undecaprenyl-phosphate/decaprenyl-phosphate GlcNAc-1-phosphate transferase
MKFLGTYLIGFLTTVLLLWLLKPLALYIRLVDPPGGRKYHQQPVPLIGGIAMFGGFLGAVFILPGPLLDGGLALLASLALVVIFGLWDDYRALSVQTRFAAQVGAAWIMIHWGDVVLYDLGRLFLPGETVLLGPLAVPFTIFSTVGVINAMNMADGVDGAAGGMAVLTMFLLALAAPIATLQESVDTLLLATSAVLAFLCFNLCLPWRRKEGASVFMGDAGSTFLGLFLAWFFIKLSQGEQRAFTPVTALWMFALPLLDTVTLLIRRVLKGRSPFAADREHLHHLLLLTGYSVNQTVLILWSLSLGLALIGLAGFYFNIPESVMFYGFLGLSTLYFYEMQHAWKVMKPTRYHKPKKQGGVSGGLIPR